MRRINELCKVIERDIGTFRDAAGATVCKDKAAPLLELLNPRTKLSGKLGEALVCIRKQCRAPCYALYQPGQAHSCRRAAVPGSSPIGDLDPGKTDETDPFVFPDMPDEAAVAIDQFLEALYYRFENHYGLKLYLWYHAIDEREARHNPMPSRPPPLADPPF